MAFVYVIQNLVNGKIYVGVTAGDLATRWKKHLSSAACNRRSKLYAAIKKYGPASFSSEVAAEFDSEDEAYKHEELLIRILDSRKNGYNTAHGGIQGVRKEISIDGVVYRSHAAAALAHDVPYPKFMDRLNKGRTAEQAVGLKEYKKFNGLVIAGGVEYRTLNAAATSLGLDRANVAKRVRNLGWTIEEALEIVPREKKAGRGIRRK